MRILLVYPHFLNPRIHMEDVRPLPIGLYYIGASLKADGFEVALLNAQELPQRQATIEKHLADFRPDVVGLSIQHANRWGGLEIARWAKAANPQVTTVFGGVGASYLWELLLTHFPEVDYVVIGEGEQTFRELLQHLQADNRSAASVIPGLALRRDGRVFRTPERALLSNLDDLPDPARYFSFQHVTLTRGCPARCRFCGSPGFWGPKVRAHSAAYFVDQIERLYRRGQRFFYFSDDTFTLQREAVITVCRAILARKLAITWVAISRVDTVDEEVLAWMRRAGCIQISYGVESGSAAIRARLGKRFRLEDIRRAFALTHRFGMLPRAYFIYGCPGENEASIQATLDLIQEIKPLNAIFYILDIFPGTALYDDYREHCGASDAVWLQPVEDVLYFETDPALDRESVLQWGRTLREGFYAMLPAFAREIDLVDDPEFYPLHADFLSRLGMTFHRGDFARIAAIPDKLATAHHLYQRALGYHADARAFLGLAMIHQQRGEFEEAGRLLAQGLDRFPADEGLKSAEVLNALNAGHYEDALARIAHLPVSAQTLEWSAVCLEALGRQPEAAACRARLAACDPSNATTRGAHAP